MQILRFSFYGMESFINLRGNNNLLVNKEMSRNPKNWWKY